MSDDHFVHLFDITQRDPKKGKCILLGSVKSNRVKIFQINWSPTSLGTFVSSGVEHIYVWSVSPKLACKKATLPGMKPG